jgi:glycosyltransferase involved in cell wall biosynthesis
VRIAVVTWSRCRIAGAETYINGILPRLTRAGHELAFWHETDGPADREPIALPHGVPAWCVAELGAERALAALRGWRPDLIYAHGLLDPELEAETLTVAPAVLFAHAYYGTCISGGKAFKNPTVRPCHRRFGWPCLLHYYPRRCGGWSPVTMLREYRNQSDRLKLLRRYAAVVTASGHMRSEYLRHGLAPDRVHVLPFDVAPEDDGVHRADAPSSAPPGWRLLFLGRMELLKGGRTLLRALPRARALVGRPLRVTFAGDGPDRPDWERQAARVQAQDPGLTITFLGWVSGRQLGSLWAECDLLVLPSLWPEPFGLAGLEASAHGVPAAAFRVGGTPDWLQDGVNGHLAPGDPPTAVGLAEAISKCLRSPDAHARLRRGAAEVAQRFRRRSHLSGLLELFQKVVQRH